MEPVAALLFMVTCTPDLVVCREKAEPVRTYATMTECTTEKQRFKAPGEGNRRVVARCVDIEPASYSTDAAVSWFLGPAGTLELDVTFENPQVASTSNGLG